MLGPIISGCSVDEETQTEVRKPNVIVVINEDVTLWNKSGPMSLTNGEGSCGYKLRGDLRE